MPNHVVGDGRLADFEAELEQLTMNARSTPERVASAHRSDQSAKFFWNARPAQLADVMISSELDSALGTEATSPGRLCRRPSEHVRQGGTNGKSMGEPPRTFGQRQPGMWNNGGYEAPLCRECLA